MRRFWSLLCVAALAGAGSLPAAEPARPWVAWVETAGPLDDGPTWYLAGAFPSRSAALSELRRMQRRAGKPLTFSLSGPTE